MSIVKLPPKSKWRKEVKGRDGIRRCIVCGLSIEERGNAARFCEEHAKAYATMWRKDYDAQPHLVERRKNYDRKPENVKKAKHRRNKKLYCLDLALWALGLEQLLLDEAIDQLEQRVEKAKKGRLIPKKERGEPIPPSAHPYKTLRGKNRSKRK